MIRWSVLLLALASCGYHPPPQTDTHAAAYETDLTSCSDTAHRDVSKQNAKRALDWFSSPVRRWGQIGDATQSCMSGKGYGRTRWCTADELKRGVGVVTAEGIQCIDPPAAEHRSTAQSGS